MDRARLSMAESIFSDLLDEAAERREARLNARCGGDSELRSLVIRLLDNDRSGMGSFLRQPAFVPSGPIVDVGLRTGERFGRYEIVRKLGEGGMGMVFEARQENPRRTVALKVLRTALPSAEMLSRFRHESEILAQLRHPGIAHVYDAGVAEFTHGGGVRIEQPYFAMELVEGQPLREFAARRRLDTPARMELLARICDAVQYAHERGVMHRDLKSDNLLVEESGQPRVLDFGVARLAGVDGETMTRQTLAGEVVGTLAYMSPEQVSGESTLIDTRSDVYALGVIAYELLSLRLPFEVRDLPLAEAARRIRDDAPPALSTLSREFRGDVETIVAKAMHRDPQRRYESAAALAGDIRRYLRDEPIEARRDSASYVLRKTLRRYRWAAMAMGAIFVLLIVAIVGTTYGLVQARRERAEAEEARQGEARQHQLAEERLAESQRKFRLAKAVTLFLTRDLMGGDDPARPLDQRDSKVSDVVARVEKRIDEGALKEDPEAEATVRNMLGHLYIGLGRITDAGRQSRLALDLAREALGTDDIETIVSLSNLAEAFHVASRLGEAAETYKLAFEIADRTKIDNEDVLGMMYNNYAELLRTQNRLNEAEPYYLKALAIIDSLEVPNERSLTVRATALSNLGELYRLRKNYDRALEYADRAVAAFRALFGEEHPSFATALSNKGLTLQQSGDLDGGEPLHRQALAIRRAVLPPEHPDISQSLNNLAALARNRKQYDEAVGLYREALEVSEKSLPPGHPYLAVVRKNIGNTLTYMGRFTEAEAELQRAYDMLSAAGGNAPPLYVQVTLEAMVKLYEKWAAAEPDSGAAQKLAEWRNRLAPSTSQPASRAAE